MLAFKTPQFLANRLTITRSRILCTVRNGHSPSVPPFIRLRPPSTKVCSYYAKMCFISIMRIYLILSMIYVLFSSKLPEQSEVIWDDSVAPETAIDFDAATSVSGKTALLAFFSAMTCICGIFGLVVLSDPEGKNPVATRSVVLSKRSFQTDIGMSEVLESEPEDSED